MAHEVGVELVLHVTGQVVVTLGKRGQEERMRLPGGSPIHLGTGLRAAWTLD
jgi:hypothetical protein